MRERKTVPVRQIIVEARFLPLRERRIEALMQSIKQVGLLHPILLVRKQDKLVLVAGRHRLEAVKRLNWDMIPVDIEAEDGERIERWRVLAEIDENLIRGQLSVALRQMLLKKRRDAYIAEHPETRRGAAGGRPPKGDKQLTANMAVRRNPSFVEDTARKTGISERSIRRDVARGRAFTDEQARKIAGTSLDSGVQMDALAHMPAAKRDDLIIRAAHGEKVNAVAVAVTATPSSAASLDDLFHAWMRLWAVATPDQKRQFVERNREALTKTSASVADQLEMIWKSPPPKNPPPTSNGGY